MDARLCLALRDLTHCAKVFRGAARAAPVTSALSRRSSRIPALLYPPLR